MKSLLHLSNVPSRQPFPADDILELHAGRILLLLKTCGIAGRIDGLTKLAKLDFFVRYPDAFDRVADHLHAQVRSSTTSVESTMVRHHYGPWDRRYYHVLAFLESRALVTITGNGKAYTFALTAAGEAAANTLARQQSFAQLQAQMKGVKKVLGGRTGSNLKKLVYDVFKEDVKDRPLGALIT